MTAAVRAYIGNLARDPLRDDLRVTAGGRVVGRFQRVEIDSAFQPIARLGPSKDEPAVVAFQALARARGETGVDLLPSGLFSLAANGDDLVMLDRRCRVVQTLNFFAADAGDTDLLLSVHERLLSAVAVDHGRAYRRVIDGLSIPARRVVIALPLLTAAQLDRQCLVLSSYRLNGLRVAVTVDQPDLLRLLLTRIPADIVRVDVRHLARPGWIEAFADARAIHAEVHATRVEDEAGRQRALVLGATHWQGWHLAQPVTWLAERAVAD
jgi:EAL domain-containing protein (putative c-di-GMP-specific phosphodiesterase class I)